MALNLALFRQVAPEFKAKPFSEFNFIVIEAEKQVSPSRWRKKTDLAVALLTAHMIKAADPKGTGNSGPIQSSTVGSLSRSYAAGEQNHALKSTRYGREFLRIRMQVSPSPFVV